MMQVILCHGFLFSKENNRFQIDSTFKEQELGQYFQYLIDTSDKIQADSFNVFYRQYPDLLKNNQQSVINLGFTQHPLWLVTQIQNKLDSSATIFLLVAQPGLKDFRIYTESDMDKLQQIAEMGNQFKGGNKIYTNRNFIIPVQLNGKSTTTLFIHISKQLEPIHIPIIITNEYNLVRRTNNDNLFLGVFFGIILLFDSILLILYFFSKNSFFLLYLAFNFLYVPYFLSDTGIGLQYIWSQWSAVQQWIPYLCVFSMILLHITFIRLFFRTSLHLIRFNNFLLFLMWLMILTVLLLVGFTIAFPDSNLPYRIANYIVNGIYLGYGLIILSLCIATLVRVRRKEVVWITIVVSIQYLNWLTLILTRGNFSWDFLDRLDIYSLNVFHTHLSSPHISMLLVLLEIFVVTIILSLNFYSFIKDNSSGEFKLMVMSRNTINAYVEGQEKERLKLTNRIQDSISQDIKMLENQVSNALKEFENPVIKARLLDIGLELTTVEKEIEKITSDFMPSQYYDKTLYDSVKMIFSFLESSGIKLKYVLFPPAPFINEYKKVGLCRILQEVAGNIQKHAHASEVYVRVFYKDDLVITIRDNGKGFVVNKNQGGIGLINIQSRVKALSGELLVESALDKGTIITIRIPMKKLR